MSNQNISAKEFIRRVKEGEYKPSGYLSDGRPVTMEAVLKGLNFVGQTNYVELLAEKKKIQEEVKKFESLPDEQQEKNIEEMRRLWALEAHYDNLLGEDAA